MPRACLALLLAGASLLAQSGEARVRVRFRALSFDGAILGAGYLDGRDVRPLDLSSDCFTAEQSYVGPNPLRLVLRDETAPAAQVVAPPTMNHAQARMLALSQELETTQRRLGTLTASARERGGKTPVAAGGEVGLLKSRIETLNREMNELAQESAKAAEPTPTPAPAPKARPEPKGKAPNPAGAPVPTPAKPERVAHRPLADFAFPGDGRFLLLVNRTAGGTTVNAIDDQEGAFPFGSMQFINLTGREVEVRFGTKTLPLAAKAKGLVRASAGHNSYAEGEIHTKGADGFHLGYSMRVFQQDDVRTLYFLLPVEDGGHGVRLKGVEERRAPEPPPTPTAEKAPAAR